MLQAFDKLTFGATPQGKVLELSLMGSDLGKCEVTVLGLYAYIFWGCQVLVGEALTYPCCHSEWPVKTDSWCPVHPIILGLLWAS